MEALRCGEGSRRLCSEAVAGWWCSNLGRAVAAVALRSRDGNDGAMPSGSLLLWCIGLAAGYLLLLCGERRCSN